MKNLIISVFGKKGSGKSYFVKNRLIPKFKRLIIFDTQNEYDYNLNSSDLSNIMSIPNHTVSTNYNELMTNLNYNYKQDSFINILQVSDIDVMTKVLDPIFKAGYFTIVIEEMHVLDSALKKNTLFRMFMEGRHRFINIISTSQRFSSVSRNLTSQSDIIACFKQTEKRDIQFVEHYTDDASELKNLSIGEFKIIEGSELWDEYFK